MAGEEVGQFAVTRLSKLRQRLKRLRQRRRRVRWGTGYSALALALLWVLVAAFLADWFLELNRPQRLVAMAMSAAAFYWAFRRYTRPWLEQRETELDVALLVQRQQRIDSDLVAALQFESPEAPQWGSVELEQEVVGQVGELGGRLDVMQGFSRRELSRRTIALSATSVVLALAIWQFPGYAATFLSRFFLFGPQHYPTQTAIESVRINGRPVRISGWRPEVAKSPYGRAVRFEVTGSGRLPPGGHVDLKTDRGVSMSVGLSPSDATGAGKRGRAAYAGELPRLVEAVDYRIYLGDAWTDPARLEVVPLPVIDVEIEVTPPSYAASGEASARTSTGLRQISVIEGSRVGVRVASDKRLEKATLAIDGQQHAMQRDESRVAAPRAGAAGVDYADFWTLPVDDTPLASVVAPVRYEIRAVDVDGLEPEAPIEGVIRIKADHAPQIAASAVTEFVLPTARPRIAYEAADDFGLARLVILPEVTHEDGRVETLDEVVVSELAGADTPPRDAQDQYPLDLATLRVVKGDRLSIVVQAVDYRGAGREGKATQTDPLVFQVTDERGILAAMAEADRESAERLKTMIQRQIEVGERQ